MKKLFELRTFVLILIVGSILFSFHKLLEDSSDTRVIKCQQFTVSAKEIKTTKVHTILEFIGTAVSNESVDITSNITQKVSSIYFSDCEFVKKGDVLVELNIEKQKAARKQAEVNLDEQLRELNRLSSLKQRKIIAAQEYDKQQTKVQDAKAKLDEVEAEIKEGTIIAPFNGVLGIRQISVGSLLTPGTVITTLDDIRKIKVDFSVPEKYLSMIDKNCKITATNVAFPNKKFYGSVLAISPRISSISRSITVRGIIENNEYFLRPGMMLNITIQIQGREALLVPENSVVNVGEKHFVYVVKAGNKVKYTKVEVGQRLNGEIEVHDGLKEGDLIVTDGVLKIADGDEVEVISKGEGENKKGESNKNKEDN